MSPTQNSVVGGAAVRLANLGTNIVQTASTDNSGNYVITPVPAGTYSISLSAPGFAKSTVARIDLQVGQIVREDLLLQIGSTIVSDDIANTGVGGQRPNLNPSGGNPNFKRSRPVVRPEPLCSPGPLHIQYGHANTLRADRYRQDDGSVFEDFAIPHERGVLLFRAELFNFANATSFSVPGASIPTSGANATIDTPTGARITSTSVPSRDFHSLSSNF